MKSARSISTNKTETQTTDQIYNTNWCNLPPELKIHCIKEMKVTERLNLRCTSKIERTLVDSQKIELENIKLSCQFNASYLRIKQKGDESETCLQFYRYESDKLVAPCLEYLLRNGIIDSLLINFPTNICLSDSFADFQDGLSIKNFDAETINRHDLFFYLKNMKGDIESIQLEAPYQEEYPFDPLIRITSVTDARLLQIKELARSDSAYKVAKKYIKKDVEVGAAFQVLAGKRGTMKKFATKFAHRIVSKTDELVRIRTNNPAKHILLELGFEEEDGFQLPNEYLRLLVISAELKESEYDTDRLKWMSMLSPNYDFSGDLGEFFDMDDPNFDVEDLARLELSWLI